jgi:hypothetical protein
MEDEPFSNLLYKNARAILKSLTSYLKSCPSWTTGMKVVVMDHVISAS